jgi:integrase
VERLVEAIDRSTALGKRDYAILLLAARYGVRPCDIRRLRLDEIHWRQQRIAFVQAKTQSLLELPLLNEVEAALVDYLRHGRPACAAREVFVRHVAPIGPFSRHNNLWDVIDRAFQASGIEPPDKRRGLYLLRHSAATRMLRQGASFETISDVLGHASADTTRVYAQVDIRGLRSVALSAAQVRS